MELRFDFKFCVSKLISAYVPGGSAVDCDGSFGSVHADRRRPLFFMSMLTTAVLLAAKLAQACWLAGWDDFKDGVIQVLCTSSCLESALRGCVLRPKGILE